ncbi:HFL148Wp [Eremothecium sinecaudum]|uniref:HFL148Wp n=1 Tax=Eremothecium sinecaudum TaxID=45286 RepID=A0A109V028_9SACH|nr:HFL148Wp [Eremothecium sinecaudum]AMD21708.1 HFL148Wp [Eremothecium sinecaudum]
MWPRLGSFSFNSVRLIRFKPTLLRNQPGFASRRFSKAVNKNEIEEYGRRKGSKIAGRVFISSILLGTVLYHTNDTAYDVMRHIAITTVRVSVVTHATLLCCYHYKRTLSKKYSSDEEYQEALSKCHKKCALIALRALEKNGGIHIKLGQHIGAMTYVLPPEWTSTMIPLQDRCPQSSIKEIDELFRHDLKRGLTDVFETFDTEPIGVASLAQVHVATLKGSGKKVAVKCQHLRLKEFVPLDVMLTQNVFNALDFMFPEYPMSWLSDELQSSIYVELDFTKEAQNAINTAKYFSKYSKLTALRIPQVISADKRILIMEFVEGERLDNLKYLDDNKINRTEVSSCLSHIFNNMIFTPNVSIHCDPHGGNLAIRALEHPYAGHNFEIILYDHGLYRTPSTELKRDYAKFWLALLDRDHEGMKKYLKKFANVTDEQFPILAAAITGRSIETALNYDIKKTRSMEEINQMKHALLKGSLLAQIMAILSRVPRIVLLILKTNDLTRSLDESLENPLGLERTFLILAQYCAKTVYDETRENIDQYYKKWSIRWIFNELKAWVEYQRRKNQLVIYDIASWWRSSAYSSM